MIGKRGERGSGISVLAARHDIYIYIYIYIYFTQLFISIYLCQSFLCFSIYSSIYHCFFIYLSIYLSYSVLCVVYCGTSSINF